MTEPVRPALPDDAIETDGFTMRRTWPVWSNRVQHRVDVTLNTVTGSARVVVDGEEVVRRSPWHMNMSGFELPFEVDGRPCLLVVRARYGTQPEMDLYSEGRSLTSGEALDDHREVARGEMPNLVRMLLLFIPLIGGFNTVLRRSDALDRALGGYGPVVVIGISVAVAAAGWWLASRWYARRPEVPRRHVVGGAIVAAAWAAFFAAFIGILVSGGRA